MICRSIWPFKVNSASFQRYQCTLAFCPNDITQCIRNCSQFAPPWHWKGGFLDASSMQ